MNILLLFISGHQKRTIYEVLSLKIMLYGIMDLLKITIILQSNHHHINWIENPIISCINCNALFIDGDKLLILKS